MMLSLRPRWPEVTLGGLDKIYRLHKWLGIGVLGLAIYALAVVGRPQMGGGARAACASLARAPAGDH